MNLPKKIILILTIMICQKSLAHGSYLVNFGDDSWSSMLLIETCPFQLKYAIDQIASEYSNDDFEVIAILPEELGYQYFRVEFIMLKNGEVQDQEPPLVYQFQYWTQYDQHRRCLKVEPYNIVN